jgi:hypothetical protein
VADRRARRTALASAAAQGFCTLAVCVGAHAVVPYDDAGGDGGKAAARRRHRRSSSLQRDAY